MKKVLSLISILVMSSMIFAQVKTKPVSQRTNTRPVSSAPILKNMNDTFSYALGVQVASFYKQEGVTKINSAVLGKAIDDIYKNNTSILSQQEMDLSIMSETSKPQYEKTKVNMADGKKFCSENKNKSGIITTASGLEYEVITQGTGQKPGLHDTVICHYRGTLLNGNIFDESYGRGAPASFPVDRVIKGWTEALQLMTVGSKYKLYIPCELGYGIMDAGTIPGGSTLVFEVELLDIKKAGHH